MEGSKVVRTTRKTTQKKVLNNNKTHPSSSARTSAYSMEGMNRYEVDEHKQTRDGPNVLANCTRQSYKEALISDSNTRRSDGGGDDDYLEESVKKYAEHIQSNLPGQRFALGYQ